MCNCIKFATGLAHLISDDESKMRADGPHCRNPRRSEIAFGLAPPATGQEGLDAWSDAERRERTGRGGSLAKLGLGRGPLGPAWRGWVCQRAPCVKLAQRGVSGAPTTHLSEELHLRLEILLSACDRTTCRVHNYRVQNCTASTSASKRLCNHPIRTI